MKYTLDMSGVAPRLIVEAESKADFSVITEVMWDKSVASITSTGSSYKDPAHVAVGDTAPKKKWAHKKHKKQYKKVCEKCGRTVKGNIGLAVHKCTLSTQKDHAGSVRCTYCHKLCRNAHGLAIHQAQYCTVKNKREEKKVVPATNYLGEVINPNTVEVLA